MPTAPDVENCEKKNEKLNYNQQDVRLLLESVAIADYQKHLQSPSKDKSTKPTFLQWLTATKTKLVNIPDNEQFWIKKQLLLAKST